MLPDQISGVSPKDPNTDAMIDAQAGMEDVRNKILTAGPDLSGVDVEALRKQGFPPIKPIGWRVAKIRLGWLKFHGNEFENEEEAKVFASGLKGPQFVTEVY